MGIIIKIHCSHKTVAEPMGSTLPVLGLDQLNEFCHLLVEERCSILEDVFGHIGAVRSGAGVGSRSVTFSIYVPTEA